MIKIDLTNSKLFDSLTEISYGDSTHFDLHNDFELKSLKYEKLNEILEFKFNEGIGKKFLYIIFEKVEILNFNIPINGKELTLDNFHRGRFESERQLFDEFNNKKCFYMEFYGEGDINLLCSKVTLKIETSNKIIKFK